MSFKKYGKHGCFISKDVHAIKIALLHVQDQVKEISNTQKKMFEAIKNLSEVKTAKFEASATPKLKQLGNIVVVGG